MNSIADFIRSAPLVDLGIFAALFAAFIVGVMQGAIRRILGIVSILFSFLVSANLREPVGNFLAQYWTQFSLGYNHLLVFAITFSVLVVGTSIFIQGLYHRQDIYSAHPIVDDIGGGLLGLLQGIVLLMIAVIILGSYTLPQAQPGDISQLREAQRLLIHQSSIAGAVRDTVVPPFLYILSPLLPGGLVSVFP